MEARHLKYLGDEITENRFQILPGVDQVGLLLVTRAINELRGEKPRVYPCSHRCRGQYHSPVL